MPSGPTSSLWKFHLQPSRSSATFTTYHSGRSDIGRSQTTLSAPNPTLGGNSQPRNHVITCSQSVARMQLMTTKRLPGNVGSLASGLHHRERDSSTERSTSKHVKPSIPAAWHSLWSHVRSELLHCCQIERMRLWSQYSCLHSDMGMGRTKEIHFL